MAPATQFLTPSLALLGALIPLTTGSFTPATAATFEPSFTFIDCSSPAGIAEVSILSAPVTCPGDTPENPLMPTTTSNGEFLFSPVFTTPGKMIFIDPDVAIGYTYKITGALFTDVQPPGNLADTKFSLYGGNAACDTYSFLNNIDGGSTYTFPSPLSCFQIKDIDEALGLSPTDPMAFVTGISVNSVGTFNVSQTPIATPAPLPLIGAGIGFGASRRLRRRIRLSQMPSSSQRKV